MDATSVRAQLREVSEQLAKLEKERDILQTLRDGLEGWLSLYPPAAADPDLARDQLKLPLPKAKGRVRKRMPGKPVGTASFRGTVPKVVLDAGGAELSTAEILTRARSRGADTEAENPHNTIEVILYMARKRGVPVDRVGQGVWRAVK